MEVLRYGEESVLLSFEEIKPHDWKEKVYQPDIQDNWEKLYRKPGYEMQLTARRSRSDGLKNGSARRSIGKPKREPIADLSSAIRFTFPDRLLRAFPCGRRQASASDRTGRRLYRRRRVPRDSCNNPRSEGPS